IKIICLVLLLLVMGFCEIPLSSSSHSNPPTKVSNTYRGKNYKIQYDLALIELPPMWKSSKQGENLTAAFLL
uniref:Uncharacterized protein n=1 Tax=Seriola lalandi dorsalis TaxID=1841481 RepID=A0A3B4Z1I4_SERLL